MPVKKPKKPNYTPVRAVQGTVVHATAALNPLETACGDPIQARGWVVCGSTLLGCEDCKKAIAKKPRRSK